MVGVWRLAVAVVLFVWASLAMGGPVNSPGSFPFAMMNSHGDAVFAGDWKIRASWQGQYAERREAAAPFRFSNASKEVFSGGVANALVNAPDAGVACSRKRVAVFSPDRSPAFPAGKWREITALSGIPIGHLEHTCAMRGDGLFGVFQESAGRVVFSNGIVAEIPKLSGGVFRLVAVGDFFAALGEKQVVWMRFVEGGVRVSQAQNHSFGLIDDFVRFASNSNFVLKVDATSVLLSRVIELPSAEFPSLGAPARIPVAPCDDKEMCGASLAADNSWTVSGYWGSYVGVDSRFVRLAFPSLARGSGGVAFAHSGLGKRFLYIGADDADAGILPAMEFSFQRADALEKGRERYLVWTKNLAAQESAKKLVFEWNLNRKNVGSFVRDDAYASFVHEGSLPQPIPPSWVAWERELSLPALLFESQEQNANASDGWWQKSIRVQDAKAFAAKRGLDSRSVVVGIVDSGADMTHPWLVTGFHRAPGEIPDNGLDDDGNGFVDDVMGYDFVGEDAEPADMFGHGSHVAGLVGARHPQTGAPVGLNENVTIRVARALDQAGKSNSIDLARAVSYLASNGVDVMNCSWGGGPVTQALRDAFSYAVNAGVLVMSSAGNDRMNTDKNPQVPKMFPGVVSVGAYSENGAKAAFSNWGKNSVHWFAPGDKIMSTLPGAQWGEKSGTSMASPIAANVASWIMGLVWAQFPNETRLERVEHVKRVMCASGMAGALQGISSCGRIDALRAAESLP